MKVRYQKYFTLAKEAGIEELELTISQSDSLSFSIFHKTVDSFNESHSCKLYARGIVNGKMGYATTENFGANSASFIVRSIIENAGCNSSQEAPVPFKEPCRHRHYDGYNPSLAALATSEKVNALKQLEDAIRNLDARISEVGGCQYEECASELIIVNTRGLKLRDHSNYFVVYADAVAKMGEDTKSGYHIELGNDFSSFHVDDFAQKVVDKTVRQLGGKPCKTGVYHAVLAPSVVSSLLGALISSLSAKEVQRHSSLMEGKLSQKVCSTKLTIKEEPLTKNVFYRSFDDEGTATKNKYLIKKGVLQTYLYNAETAQKDQVESTGNGYRRGAKIGTQAINVRVLPGQKSEEELFESMRNGIYITDVTGLHAGLNEKSGDFSLQAKGFLVEDGKVTSPVNLITIAGNLLTLFQGIKEIGNNNELQMSSYSVPSISFHKLMVSGE